MSTPLRVNRELVTLGGNLEGSPARYGVRLYLGQLGAPPPLPNIQGRGAAAPGPGGAGTRDRKSSAVLGVFLVESTYIYFTLPVVS